jgi:hypothetical protein
MFREIHEELIEQWHFEVLIQKKKKSGVGKVKGKIQ